MIERVLLGFEKEMVSVPIFLYRLAVLKGATDIAANVRFKTDEHQQVHNCVVMKLGRRDESEPVSAKHIAQELSLPESRVNEVLDELEKAWVFRNEEGNVRVAIPFSYDKTPHLITLDNGEQKHSI